MVPWYCNDDMQQTPLSALTYDAAVLGGAGPFRVTFAPVTRPVKSWKEEVYEAAQKIGRAANKPLMLSFSGGIDSEVMCNAFFEQGWSFTAVTFEYTDGGNEHDIRYAKEWCRERGVTQEIVRVDMRSFLQSGIDAHMRDGYITGNIFRYLQIEILKFAEKHGGYAVLGGGEQLYITDPSVMAPTKDDVYLSFEIGYAVPLEWCKRNNASHQPYFYFSTPELCRSYLNIPLVDYAVNHNPEIFRNISNRLLFKRMNYQTVWPDMTPRFKYSGFEKMADLRAHAEARLRDHFKDSIQTYSLPVPELRRQLAGN